MLQQLGDGLGKALEQVVEGVAAVVDALSGVATREKDYTGGVILHNNLAEEVTLSFSRTSIPRYQLSEAKVGPGEQYTFDPGKTQDFDYLLVVQQGKARVNVVRGGTYQFRSNPNPNTAVMDGQIIVELVRRPERRRSDALTSTPGLSFSFSASGWLFVYQLGCAECLQAHGIAKNPYVRVSGASGGALTAATMMYGCDMSGLKDVIKSSASTVYKDVSQAIQLRLFVLEAMKTFVKDGSYKHPAFQDERVEIAVSESAEDSGMTSSLIQSKTKNRRCKKFENTAQAAVALLASASMGISGMPFIWKNAEGKDVKVADGALTEFLPVIDELSVKVKPFSDGLNLMGGKPDVTPTEWIPGSYGLFPPLQSTIDHIYELGYRDMEAWVDNHLAERLEKCQEEQGKQLGNDVPVLPPVTFTCPDNGMTWYNEVVAAVPVSWTDQLSAKDFENSKPIKEGWLDLSVSIATNGNPQMTNHGRRWVVLKKSNFLWRADSMPPAEPAPVVEDNRAEQTEGEIPVHWILNMDTHLKDPNSFKINTSDLQVLTMKAATQKDANDWSDAFRKAVEILQRAEEQETKAKEEEAAKKEQKKKAKCCVVS